MSMPVDLANLVKMLADQEAHLEAEQKSARDYEALIERRNTLLRENNELLGQLKAKLEKYNVELE